MILFLALCIVFITIPRGLNPLRLSANRMWASLGPTLLSPTSNNCSFLVGGPTEESGMTILFDRVQTLASDLAQLGERIVDWLESSSGGATVEVPEDFRVDLEICTLMWLTWSVYFLANPYLFEEAMLPMMLQVSLRYQSWKSSRGLDLRRIWWTSYETCKSIFGLQISFTIRKSRCPVCSWLEMSNCGGGLALRRWEFLLP